METTSRKLPDPDQLLLTYQPVPQTREEILKEIDKRLSKEHSRIIQEAVDLAKIRIERTEASESILNCTYARNIGEYIAYKMLAFRTDKFLSMHWDMSDNQARSYQEKYKEACAKAHYFRNRMYSAPCYKCFVCQSRRKQWPKKENFYRGVHEPSQTFTE